LRLRRAASFARTLARRLRLPGAVALAAQLIEELNERQRAR
jgi:hypothetical protein